ncbi:ATP-binding protein [Desulforhabdus sp. TSK]|uniref:ATP-binding protein n=1 Tax=Desulforhabdus sp. TSK TaxID=2925014 RepID=UPI001FC868A7|nr:ATP-binding protein [Desulforhabdus sp. TSK]GKT09155.1 hypothetical protein DSTSK_24600 [Desulforhabdus sp. TSK]
MPIEKDQANFLFQLACTRFDKEPSFSPNNCGFEDWGPVFADQVVATAIIDRLVHHSHIFAINRNGFRMKEKLKEAAK